MPIADFIRREADAWRRAAGQYRADSDERNTCSRVSVILRNIAGVTEVHGLAGLHGYIACLSFSHSVTDTASMTVKDVIARILRGEGH